MPSSKINQGDISQSTPVGDALKHYNGWHHPNFDPVALALGPVEVRWYSLAYLCGIVLGWVYISYINKKYGHDYLPAKVIEALPLWIVFSVILGGRLGYVLFYNFQYYIHNLADIFKVWHGGMSFHGGLLGVITGIFIFSRVHKLEYLRITDYLAVVAPFGLFFGRIANFINKELVGDPTNVKWAVIYPDESFGRHPSQLYEAGMEGVLLFIILYISMRLFNGLEKKGTLSGLFLIFYSIFRMVAELFRTPDKQLGYLYGGLTMGQMLSIPMLIIGLSVFILAGKSSNKQQTA